MSQIILFDFSGIYKEETFWRNEKNIWLDMGDIQGTNCYCDEDAAEEILRRTEGLTGPGLRYIDSGNYHYMTHLLANHVQKPFNLLVFDHHTDMQAPQFGEILSCGGWIRHLITENPLLNRLVLVGPPEQDYKETEEDLKKKVVLIGDDQAVSGCEGRIVSELENYPLYISVDKDVLGKEDAKTSWTQGRMTGDTLIRLLDKAVQAAGKENVLAVDVCGERTADDYASSDPNDRMNRRIFEWYRGIFDEE